MSTPSDSINVDNTAFKSLAPRPSVCARNEFGECEIEWVGADAFGSGEGDEGPAPIRCRGGKCLPEDIGTHAWNNLVFRSGMPSTVLSGECAGMNFLFGDTRMHLAEGEWIAAEFTLVGNFGYDPSPTPAPGSDPPVYPEATPYYFRIHTGRNTRSGKRVGLRLRGDSELVLESGNGQVNVVAGDTAAPSGYSSVILQPGLTLRELADASIPTPPANMWTLYVGADHGNRICAMNSARAVTVY